MKGENGSILLGGPQYTGGRMLLLVHRPRLIKDVYCENSGITKKDFDKRQNNEETGEHKIIYKYSFDP